MRTLRRIDQSRLGITPPNRRRIARGRPSACDSASARGKKSERDVLVAPAACRGLGQRLGELAAGVCGVDLLVDHTDLDGAVDAAGDPLVLGGQLLVQRFALVVRRGGQLLLV